jgi:hypothetical protein
MQVYYQIAWNMLVGIHMDSKDDDHGAWVDMPEDWTNRQLGAPPDPGTDPKRNPRAGGSWVPFWFVRIARDFCTGHILMIK